MALVVYWYDSICFGIVGVAFLGALYVLWKREGSGKCEDRGNMYKYESLLLARPDSGTTDAFVISNTPRGHVSSSQLWTSCWRGVHPIWLLGLRFTFFVLMSGILAWDINSYDSSVFVYYTEWTFALVIIYFAIGTIVSAHGCIVYYSKKPPSDNRERDGFLQRDVEESKPTNGVDLRVEESRGTIKLESDYNQEVIRQRAGFWGYLMQTAYQCVAGAVILTDIVFWCIIVPFLTNIHYELNTLMGCMHTLNLLVLLIDTSLNSLPFPWFRIGYFVLWSCSYVIFQWLIHACGFSWWPYPFLQLSTPWAPLWYFCLAVVHIPCYGLYSLLVRVKNSIFARLFPRAFVRSF